MDAHFSKAEGFFLLSPPRHPDADRILQTRAAAGAAREAAFMAHLRRVATLLFGWPRRQRLLAELRAMSDRDLSDIGLNRGEFDRVLAMPRSRREAIEVGQAGPRG